MTNSNIGETYGNKRSYKRNNPDSILDELKDEMIDCNGE